MNHLLLLKKLTPLAEVVSAVDPAAYLGKSLYRLGNGAYIYLTKFGGVATESAGPFLSGLFCAPDDGAMMRVTGMDIEKDNGLLLARPVFLPAEMALEYGAILNWLKDMQPAVLQEAASYRIAVDGDFVHRTIETERYTVYFRGADDDFSEPPYAFLYKYQAI